MQGDNSKPWAKLAKCWDQLTPHLKQINDKVKTQMAPIATQCATWLQSGSASEEIQIGNRTFAVVEKLGEGGYSFVNLVTEVLPGQDAASGPKYAVKKVLADRQALHEAEHEITIMKRLNHPFILPLLDSATVPVPAGTSGGATHIVYMLFPLYEGGNLWDYVLARMKDKHTPLSSQEIVTLGLQLCAGLAHMHAQGLAHWDIKPHNVLLSWKDAQGREHHHDSLTRARAVIIDFGSTRQAKQDTSTRQAAVMVQEQAERHATAPYRPPELWDVGTGSTVDERVDVWELGCVLYFAMVGESPFERLTNMFGGSLPIVVASGNYRWPQDVQERYPDQLKDVVKACLNVNSQERPHIGDIENMLKAITL